MADDKVPIPPEVGKDKQNKEKSSKSRNRSSKPETDSNSQIATASKTHDDSTLASTMSALLSEVKKMNGGVGHLTQTMKENFDGLHEIMATPEQYYGEDMDCDDDDDEIPCGQYDTHRDSFVSQSREVSRDSTPVMAADSGNQPNSKIESDHITVFRHSLGLDAEKGDPFDQQIVDIIQALFDYRQSEGKPDDATATALHARLAFHKKPANCPILNVPICNKILWDNISGQSRAVDTNMQKIQHGVVTSSIAVARALESVFVHKEDIPKELFDHLTTMLGDSLQILGDTNLSVIQRRKELLRPEIKSEFRGLCSTTSGTTPELLFGEDVVKHVRDLGTANRIGRSATRLFTRRPNRRFPYNRGRGRTFFSYQGPSYGYGSGGPSTGYRQRPFLGRGGPRRFSEKRGRGKQ